ncbi:uncharacterized protein LOC128712856 [Anopheles marshallii]|uniref:uncharacterized protein LOC128712856 n=1 Tax=Anopheles marshallii TaxID=1521116 RepID=UPI00237C0AED|nr:uncharacterized protein LOC128712856 [Anopheles marshallii]
MDVVTNSDCPLSSIIDGPVDQQCVADFLETSTIETALEFESLQGQSPLVRCIQSGVSHLDTVRCMLNSGLYDCETIDSTGRAALASLAFECRDNKLHIKRILDVVTYVEDQDEEQMFQSIATAIIHLNARRIPLLELRLYVGWKLADYGYRKLTGNWTDGKTLDDWKSCIQVISDCWNDIIKHNYASNDAVDDRFMHRLRMIHNQLYFLKFKKFLEHLPIWETVFCVAIFMNTYDEPNNYRFYRLMISKGTVIKCLGPIVSALERVKDELAKIEPEISRFVTDVMHNDSKYDALFDEMVAALEASNIKNKKYMASNFREKQASGQCAKHELAKEVAKVFKRAETSYCDTKMVEIRALESRDALISKIKTRLDRVVHPENVCNRLMAEMRQNVPTDTIVASIIAGETFNFNDLSLAPGVMEAIGQCYSQMKPFYSLVKIHKCISIFARADTTNMSRFTACAKRLLTVIGEAINNTKNTPNMPDTRVEAAVQRMLMYQFKTINNWHRNTYTHELSRARLEVKEDTERQLLKQMPQHLGLIGLMLELLLIAIGADIRHSFYGMLYRCETLESLRALLIYVGETDVLRAAEEDWWDDVLQYYKQAGALLQQVRQQPVGQTSQFAQVERSFNMQLSIIEELKEMVAIEAEFNYESVRKTCTSCNNLATIKSLLSWKLDSYDPTDTLERMCNSWDADISNLSHIAWENPQLLQLNPLAASTTLTRLQKALLSVGQYNYAHHTRKLIETLGCVELHSVNETEWQELNRKLVPYYQNVFQLDIKWKELKAFCVKRDNAKPWNSAREHELRQRDQQELQQMFDERRKTLRSVLVQCGIRTVGDLITKLLTIPSDALAAMEYVQVELCQMLLAVKYFGDNFEALKHSIPMIQGKSYRNYLAHDALSYDILTCSGEEKCVINAFIFARTSVRLFAERPAVPSMFFPPQEDTKRWIDQQQELRAAFVSGDVRRIHALMMAGAEIRGLYYGSPDIRYHPTTRLSITNLVEWLGQVSPNVVALLKRYFPTFEANYRNPQRRLTSALYRGNLEEAFEMSKYNELPDLLLVWPNLPLESLRQRCQGRGWQAVLKELLDHGNEQCARQVIKDSASVIATQADGNLMNELLHHAMLRGMYQTASLLLSQMRCRMAPKTVELAIVVHWNDFFKHDAVKPALADDSNLQLLLTAAVQVSNYEVMGYFLNRETSGTISALWVCYVAAACYGNAGVLENLLEHYPPGMDGTLLTVPLYRATTNNYWDCVRLLLDNNAAADVIFHDRNGDKCCTLLMLIRLDRIDLIRCIRSINCSAFCSPSIDHPFSVASDYDTLSEEMIEAIKSLGFSCLDTPKILHATVEEGFGHPLWREIWEQIDGFISHPGTELTDPVRLLANVLYRWRWIAFIEMPYDGKTALGCAVAADDELKVLHELLTRARLMRTLAGDGLVLGDLAIRNGSTTVWFGGNDQYHAQHFTRGCDEIIALVGTLRQQKPEPQWQDYPIDIGELSILFATPDGANGHLNTGSNLQMRDTTSLVENLHDLLTISHALFAQQSTVYATVSTSTRTVHFLRTEGWCCAYDVFPLCSALDLSHTMNARLGRGNTVLFNAIMYDCELASIKLLVDKGANPLLADNNGNTAIAAAIEHKSDPAFALYLMEACIAKDFRDAHGCGLAEMVDESGRNRFLHLADACGHQTAAQFLHRLESRMHQ